MNRLNKNRIKSIVKKDIKEVFTTKMVMLPLILVPVILCIVIPAVLLVLFLKIDISLMNGMELLEKIIPLYSVPEVFAAPADKIAFIFFNYTFLPFFMIIPLMVSSIIAANAVVGEKERKTLETLLYTPITNTEFLIAKLLSSFLPAVLVSVIAFAGYFIAVNAVSLILRNILLVRTIIWLPAMLLMAPSVSLLGLAVTLLVSLKAKSFMEAQQTSAVIVVPFLALIFVQLTGVVTFKPLYFVIFSAVFSAAAYVIITKIGPRFDRERIISTI
jgi:ABC-type Na+ efflux pump permease subunit